MKGKGIKRSAIWRRTAVEWALAGYKLAVSPLLHAVSGRAGSQAGACRFQPTCSEYAAIAVSEHGLVRGGWMALRRLARCHPFSRGGFDPVPAKSEHPDHKDCCPRWAAGESPLRRAR
ncbi:membrane protein insertion efficiency factor YidD [Silvibacterium dinghuense]|uniref:Putative membrane protein insertion efficiency factor n=1 Tax=Silvibacterium dinghuense TaxID=1560006 RepID=A0A4Q1SKE2_9BACT|nr:membrane protein insertion efficiency factor YidD [Silvibacterium dinghuense]RXS97760.1 membrane protein insertion efficiency factor YidD [Silvibacterium dinghuense]GGH01803.1 hypothetical protein GCM10011586_16850 [Silvibacterium dinghuense]